MSVIRKKSVVPIILETHFYRDRFGSPNRFVEMNPSLWIGNDGSYILLVRTVNYLKYKDRSFQIYGDHSRSLYLIVRGTIEHGTINLDTSTVHPLEVEYSLPTYPSLWYGVEDIRFLNETTVLACIPECNRSSPCLFQGTLQGNRVTSFVKCEPSVTEKNWMPYLDGSMQKVLYSVSPLIVKSIQGDDRTTLAMSEEDRQTLEGWHGSSNAIGFDDGRQLFLIHTTREKVWHRWLTLHPVTQTYSFSKEFTFFRDSSIEFACSLATYKGAIFVSVGVNDNHAMIVELQMEEIQRFF